MSNLAENEIPMEQRSIRQRCFHRSNTFAEFRIEEIQHSLCSRFEQQVETHPTNLAVKSPQYEFTYQQLNLFSNQIAQSILSGSHGRAFGVALLLDTDAPVIAAILGTLKVGLHFVTLDPEFPEERIRFMLADSEAKLILTDTEHLALADQLSQNEIKVINIDQLDSLPDANPSIRVSPQDMAYIIYTSGSTGQPKGIVFDHRSVLLGIRNYTNAFHICSSDRLAMMHSVSFSSAMVDIFLALLNGAATFPWNVKKDGMSSLAEWLREQEISIFDWVPTPFRYFAETLNHQNQLPSLRLLVLASEPVYSQDIELYKQKFSPECIMVNRLGTTEAYNFRLYFLDRNSQIQSSQVPAGYAVPDKEVVLFGEDGEIVGVDTIGEIGVKSKYLAREYWKQPALTKAAFQTIPGEPEERIYLTGDLGLLRADGCLEYLGRKDFQIKIRGHRIEISEIENRLIAMDEIKEAVVTAREDNVGEKQLIAYYVLQNGQFLSPEKLRSYLSASLPDYMLPAAFMRLDSLPTTPTGKLNRKALPEIEAGAFQTAQTVVAPRDEVDFQIIQMWEGILTARPIGIQDNFFEIGGHSISALQLLSIVEKEFDRKISAVDFFQSPTVEFLSSLIREEPDKTVQRNWSPLATLHKDGEKTPFFCIPGNMGNVFTDLSALSQYLGQAQPFYAFQDSLIIPANFKRMAARYLKELKKIQPEGPYLLGGVCIGAVVAYEMAQQLQSNQDQVALLVMIEPARPWGPSVASYYSALKYFASRFIPRLRDHSENLTHLNAVGQQTYFRLKLKVVRNVLALRNYSPKPYSGRTDIILSTDSYAKANNPQLLWKKYLRGRVEIEQVPGTHSAITGDNDTYIAPETMKEIAGVLKPVIEDAIAADQDIR